MYHLEDTCMCPRMDQPALIAVTSCCSPNIVENALSLLLADCCCAITSQVGHGSYYLQSGNSPLLLFLHWTGTSNFILSVSIKFSPLPFILAHHLSGLRSFFSFLETLHGLLSYEGHWEEECPGAGWHIRYRLFLLLALTLGDWWSHLLPLFLIFTILGLMI